MNANPWTQISLPVTLVDLIEARDKALALHKDARRLNAMAEELLGKVGSYLMPRGAQFYEGVDRAMAQMDCSFWRRAFDLTGFKQLMDAEAIADFERSLQPQPPEFTDANIRATFIDLHQQSGAMFRRGVVNVFRHLSDDYKTNSAEPFRIGRKVVIGWIVGPSFKRGLQIRIGTGDKLGDIDRVMQTLDGKPFTPRALEFAINAALEKGEPYECANYRAKGFKNGNLHLEFKRPELLDGLNEQIALHYGNALARGRE